MCCCVNAIGHSLPPVYIFSRVHFKNCMLKGDPSESLGLAHLSVRINGDLFTEELNYFIRFMKVSQNNSALLLMIITSVISLLLQLKWPKKTDCAYLPFQRLVATSYNLLISGCMNHLNVITFSLCNSFITFNPGKAPSIHDVAEFSDQAFFRSFSVEISLPFLRSEKFTFTIPTFFLMMHFYLLLLQIDLVHFSKMTMISFPMFSRQAVCLQYL